MRRCHGEQHLLSDWCVPNKQRTAKFFQLRRRRRTIIKGRIYTNGGRERERAAADAGYLLMNIQAFGTILCCFTPAPALLYHHIKQYDRVRRRSYLHYWLRTPISSDEKTHLSTHLNNKKVTTPLRGAGTHTHSSLFAFDINQSSAQENKLKKRTAKNVDCNLNNKFLPAREREREREGFLHGHCRGELIIYNQNGNSNLCGWTEESGRE